MSLYAGAPRERLIEIDTTLVEEAPTRGQVPHITLSPRTAQGLPTEGIALTLIQTSVGAALGAGADEGPEPSGDSSGGFNITLYRAVPALGTWAELAPFTALAHYGEQLVLPDLSGGWGLFFRVGGVTIHGRLLLAVAEMD